MMRALLLFLVLGSVVLAQEQDPDPIQRGPNASPKLPADACLYATVRVKEIVALPQLKLLPWELVSAGSVDNFGFDFLSIERLDLVIGPGADPLGAPMNFVLVARTNKPLQFNPKFIEQVRNFQNSSLVVLNDRFTLLGDYTFMKRLVNEPPADGELKRQVARFSDDSLVSAVLVLAPLKEHLDKFMATASPEAREFAQQVVPITKLIAARFDMKDQSIPLLLEADNEADAIAVEKALRELAVKLLEISNAQVQAGVEGLPERLQEALLKFSQRQHEELSHVAQIKRNGAQITTKIDQEYMEVSQMGTNVSIVTSMLHALEQLRARN